MPPHRPIRNTPTHADVTRNSPVCLSHFLVARNCIYHSPYSNSVAPTTLLNMRTASRTFHIFLYIHCYAHASGTPKTLQVNPFLNSHRCLEVTLQLRGAETTMSPFLVENSNYTWPAKEPSFLTAFADPFLTPHHSKFKSRSSLWRCK